MSIWQEQPEPAAPEAQLVDVAFKLSCHRIPVDHAAALANALTQHAPWLAEEALGGIHSIHVAGSQNGWERPDATEDNWLILSKRTRLRLRVPANRVDSVLESLCNKNITIAGEALQILAGAPRALTSSTTLFCRYCTYQQPGEAATDEQILGKNVIKECESIGFSPTKMLFGRENPVETESGALHTRSVLLTDIPPQYSIPLQEHGLGNWRLLGCGIPIPHKDTAAVN